MSSRPRGVVFVSVVVGGIGCSLACGGASSSELFAGGLDTSPSPTEPAPSSGSSGSSGTSSSSGSSGSSGTNDAGTDGASAWKSPGIFCGEDGAGGDVYCATSTQACCARRDGPRPSDKSFECVASSVSADACERGQSIRCDDASDCPSGQMCCGAFNRTLGYRRIGCAPTCNKSPIPGLTPVRFCDAKAPVDECAAGGKKCTPSDGLPGFHVCK